MKRILPIYFVMMTLLSYYAKSDEVLIKEIAQKVNKDNVEQIIKDLSGVNSVMIDGVDTRFITRVSISDLNDAAAKYIYNKFLEYETNANISSITPEQWTFSLETPYSIKIGKKNPGNIILFCANFDSPGPKKSLPKLDTMPGANGNASGIAIMLEASRLLNEYDTDNTIIYAGFDDCFDSNRGMLFLIDSLITSGFDSLKAIFLYNLAGNSDSNLSAIVSYDTTQINNITSVFKDISETLNLNRKFGSVAKQFTFLSGFTVSGYSEILYANDSKIDDSLFRTKQDIFENLNLENLNDNAKIAISALAVLAGAKPKGMSVGQEFNSEITISPNPASDFITISLSPMLNKGLQPLVQKVQIFDVLGVEIISTPSASQPPLNEGNLRIDVSKLPTGVYFVKAGTYFGKFIKTEN